MDIGAQLTAAANTIAGGGTGTSAGTAAPALSPISGFLESALWSPLSLIGVEPSMRVQRWQAHHPIGSFVSQLAGYAVPYAGWAKAAEGVPLLGEAIAKVAEGAAEAPIKAGIARELTTFAPFEAARIAAAATGGQALANKLHTQFIGTGGVIRQSAFDLGALGGVGAVGGALRAAGEAIGTARDIKPGVDLNAAPQEQLQGLVQKQVEGVGDPTLVANAIKDLKFEIVGQEPRKVVGELDTHNGTKAINRLFKASHGDALDRNLLFTSVGKPSFRSKAPLEAVLKAAGMDNGFEQWTLAPRWIVPKSEAAQRTVGQVIKNHLDPVDGWFYSRDKADGLFVVAKHLEPKDTPSGWIMFKTSNPGYYMPKVAEWAKLMEDRIPVFGPRVEAPTALGEGADVYNVGAKFLQDVPLIDTRGIDTRVGLAKKVFESSGLSKVEGLTEAASRVKKFSDQYLAPAMFQFRNSPIAARALSMVRALRDAADGSAEKVFLGARVLAGRPSLFGEILHGAQADEAGGLKGMIAALYKDPAQVEAFWRATKEGGLSPEEAAAKYGLGGPGLDYYNALNTIDTWQISGMQKVQEAAGESVINPKPFHLMLSRFWRGDWRVPVMEGNRTLGMASGEFRSTALKQAKDIVAAANADGLHFRFDAPTLTRELPQDLIHLRGITVQDNEAFGKYLNKSAPTTATHVREGARYYVGFDKSLTQKEMGDAVLRQLQKYQTYQAKLSAKALLNSDLNRLRASDPSTYTQLVDRINKTFGEQGRISTAINKASDVVLSPYMGHNSASKIVASANKFMFRWTLGFWNVGYNIANSLNVIQTGFPMLSFLTTAAPEEIAKYYSYWPVEGMTSRNAIGLLDVSKLMKQSFREMGRPDAALRKAFERGAQEGIWDPRFVEMAIGEKSAAVTNLRGVLRGEQSLSDWFAAGADFLPGLTEKFSRAQSFALGHVFFRDILGAKDPEMLYQLTKQFVEKSQFLYSTGDRANIITGPVGSALGLFKNWIMHYIGWMMEYTGEGVLHGNWQPLLWMLGGTTAIGGVAATPLYAAANELSKVFSHKTAMQQLYGYFNGDKNTDVADSVFYGLPAFFRFSIQNRISMPGTNPGADASQLFSLAYLERMKYVGRTVGAAIDDWTATGQSPVRDPHVRDLFMRAFAPRSIYRLTQATKAGVLRSLSTGNPVLSGMTATQRYMFDLGIDPVAIARNYRAMDELWANQDAMQAEVRKLGTAWADALQNGDYGAMDTIITRAVASGVDVGSVLKSAKARLAKGQEDSIQRQFTPQAAWEYQKLGIIK